MITLNPQYVIDHDKHPKAVLLTIKEWNEIVAVIEELEDIRNYDDVKAGSQEAIPLEQAVREIQGKY